MLGDGQHRTTLNTYYSLTASTLGTFALSALVGEHGRLDMVRERALGEGGQRDGQGEDLARPGLQGNRTGRRHGATARGNLGGGGGFAIRRQRDFQKP